MLEKTSRDAHLVPAMDAPRQAIFAFLDAAAGILMTGRPERGGARRRTSAAVSHALLFATWQSLVRTQDLSNAEAAAVMVSMVEGAGAARAPRSPHA
jgi:hypothetical protein